MSISFSSGAVVRGSYPLHVFLSWYAWIILTLPFIVTSEKSIQPKCAFMNGFSSTQLHTLSVVKIQTVCEFIQCVGLESSSGTKAWRKSGKKIFHRQISSMNCNSWRAEARIFQNKLIFFKVLQQVNFPVAEFCLNTLIRGFKCIANSFHTVVGIISTSVVKYGKSIQRVSGTACKLKVLLLK